jgi:hypothetical protein
LCQYRNHNRAAFLAYGVRVLAQEDEFSLEAQMRMLVGMILGCAITLGGLYVADRTMPSATTQPMVNWDVVAKNIDAVVALAKDGWKKIAG